MKYRERKTSSRFLRLDLTCTACRLCDRGEGSKERKRNASDPDGKKQWKDRPEQIM